ncbi:MAG: SGNH/GDSL hydrolase family protein [Desulfobacterales bacterium]|nr:SGNH/GDSL hydrolase family protein [Desulfobacterales bacterium]
MLPIPSKVILGPMLLLQGLWVRVKTPILPEAEGPRTGRSGAGPCLRLLVVGDSSAAGVGAASQAQALLGYLTQYLARHYTVQYRLVAQTGATTRDALKVLAAMATEPQDVVLTALGVNDLTGQRKMTAWLADQQRLIDLLRVKFNPQVILISSLPPMHRFPALPQPLRWHLGKGARIFNAALEELSSANAALFLPLDFSMQPEQMATDGFHPGPDIYAEWGRRAAARIRQGLATNTAVTEPSLWGGMPPN